MNMKMGIRNQLCFSTTAIVHYLRYHTCLPNTTDVSTVLLITLSLTKLIIYCVSAILLFQYLYVCVYGMYTSLSILYVIYTSPIK